MVNNDFIYKTMEEMKVFPRLAHLRLRGSIRRYYATDIVATKVVIVIVVFIARFNTGLCCLRRLLGERFLNDSNIQFSGVDLGLFVSSF